MKCFITYGIQVGVIKVFLNTEIAQGKIENQWHVFLPPIGAAEIVECVRKYVDGI